MVEHLTKLTSAQHRFIETALGSLAGSAANKIAAAFGYGGASSGLLQIASNFVGEYLHTFA